MATKRPDEWDIINCLAGIAEVARQRGAVVTAANLYASSAALEAVFNASGHYSQPHLMAFYLRLMAAVPEYRQDPVFEAAWQKGEQLSFDEAVELALAP
jgi:hypothetical protein